MTVVLAAHETRNPAGDAVAHQLADALRARLAGRPVSAQDSPKIRPGSSDPSFSGGVRRPELA
ncbi:MAG TPA: hypothetical protein VJS67_07750 [Pseudonocardiaceae bacterium]|nr:hypothetical protein [Pseudonocardiaceae bacterium]